LLIDVGGRIDTETLARVRDVIARLEQAAIPGVTDIVPGYTTVAVHYDPCDVVVRTGAGRDAQPSRLMRVAIEGALAHPAAHGPVDASDVVEIPIVYGGAHGPDLGHVAALHGMAPEEVAAAHADVIYTVHLVGFVPGFPYLGGLDPRLATPRRESPRAHVAAGSVGIGGEQTGIYPVDSPGGWQLIGRTPLPLFDATRSPPARLRVGDRVRFRAIDDAGYLRLMAERT
jgi:inhibitor of KinA